MRCKDTKKIANNQYKCKKFAKQNDFVYLCTQL